MPTLVARIRTDAASGACHSVVLNKFPIISGHVVVVPEGPFRPQTEPLETSDMLALWTMVSQLNGLGFFNGGFLSGASQPRRHLQFVTFAAFRDVLPGQLREAGLRMPLDGLIEANRARVDAAAPGEPFSLPALPFPHAFARLGADIRDAALPAAAVRLQETYLRLLREVAPEAARLAERRAASPGAAPSLADLPRPEADPSSHNLLLTPTLMFLAPRAQEHWKGASINSMGFAGTILTRPGSDALQALHAYAAAGRAAAAGGGGAAEAEGSPLAALRSCVLGDRR